MAVAPTLSKGSSLKKKKDGAGRGRRRNGQRQGGKRGGGGLFLSKGYRAFGERALPSWCSGTGAPLKYAPHDASKTLLARLAPPCHSLPLHSEWVRPLARPPDRRLEQLFPRPSVRRVATLALPSRTETCGVLQKRRVYHFLLRMPSLFEYRSSYYTLEGSTEGTVSAEWTAGNFSLWFFLSGCYNRVD